MKFDNTEIQINFQDSRLCFKTRSSNWTIEDRLILNSAVHTSKDGAYLEVVHAVEKESKLTYGKLVFTGNEDECRETHNAIESSIKCKRPRRLLVFINPRSGKRDAQKIYKKQVLPVFRMCGIETKEYVTSRPNEVGDCLKNTALNIYDGVVAVGGDGIYNEVMSALLDREMRDNGLNPDDPEAKLVQLRLPIGLIPAGSGNYTAWYLNGTKCPKTAALTIAMGQCVPTNIASLHQGNTCSCYSGLILGFGLFGDMMKDCEQYRWMGTSRFKVIPVGTLLNRRPVNITLSYIPTECHSESPNNVQIPKPDFSRQTSVPLPSTKMARASFRKRTFSTSDMLEEPSDWRTAEDRVAYAVDTYPITMEPKGKKMVPTFGEDSLKLLITRKCKLTDHIRQLKAVDDGKSSCYEFDFVTTIKVQRYRVRVLKNKTEDFYINCDGEVIRLQEPEFQVSLHRNVVQLYGKAG